MKALLLIFLLAPAARADTSCLSWVAGEISQLRAAFFPELSGMNLVLETYDSKDSFFSARPRSVWGRPDERVYAVLVNNRVCSEAPPPDAEKAILAHELAHLSAYSTMGRRALLALGWEYLVRPDGKTVEEFEKRADDTAVKFGLAPGLADYRDWLYARIPPAAAERKRRLYRSPEELRAQYNPKHGI